MNSFSDEPVLVPPSAQRDWKRWLAIAAAVALAAVVIYIPVSKNLVEERAHDAQRGERQGVLTEISVDGAPHTLELTWVRGHFAPILKPAPAPGTTLDLSGRFGSETLTWNTEIGAFGPGNFEVDPYAHYKLSLRLKNADRELWKDSLWAYGVHDSHDH